MSMPAFKEGPKPSLGLPQPYLLFLGDVTRDRYAKTAYGLRDWAPERCVGEFALAAATVSAGLTPLNPAQAVGRGARALVIGVANSGGVISLAWIPALVESLEAGLDLISGMHSPLSSVPELKAAADRLGRRLIDVRVPPRGIPIASGRKRSGLRLLTVGTDCAVGKKYTALAIARAFEQRGVDVDFRATGQTGIMIAGGGMPMDAVVSDFEAGAAEILSPDAEAGHWDVIEGQGSVFHPAYGAVSLGLLHGSQPDVIVVCHDAARIEVLGHESYSLPSLEETIELTLTLARRTNPAVRCGGISLNTSAMADGEAEQLIARTASRLGVPVADPVRGGPAFDALVSACLSPPAA